MTTVTEYYINDKFHCYSLLYPGQVSVEYLHWQEHNASLCAELKKGRSEGLQRELRWRSCKRKVSSCVHISLILFSCGTLIVQFVETADKQAVLKLQNVGV
jgi:hypothetical protein